MRFQNRAIPLSSHGRRTEQQPAPRWDHCAVTGGRFRLQALSHVLRSVLHWVMADTITFRPDEDAARALSVLTRDGTPVSAAVRAALIAAARDQARVSLRTEAQALAADAQDRAEAAQVLRDMESLRAW